MYVKVAEVDRLSKVECNQIWDGNLLGTVNVTNFDHG